MTDFVTRNGGTQIARRAWRWVVGWIETLRIMYDPREAEARADLRESDESDG